MDLTICLVNYNSKELTLKCLQSLVKKNKGSFEIILVDNNSTDGSQDAVKEQFPQAVIIENNVNVGFARANNQAIHLTKGKYVILLNNDTALRNNALDLMVAFMEKNPQIGILTCKLFEPDGQIQKNCRSFPLSPFDTIFGRASLLSRLFPNNPISRKNVLSDWDYNSPRQIDWVSGAAMMIRKKIFDQIGMLDEKFYMYWEDTDFCKRANDAGWSIWFTPEAEIIHYTGMGGGKRSLWLRLYTLFQIHYGAYYYFLKHYYKTPFHPLAILTFIGMLLLLLFKMIGLLFGTCYNYSKGGN